MGRSTYALTHLFERLSKGPEYQKARLLEIDMFAQVIGSVTASVIQEIALFASLAPEQLSRLAALLCRKTFTAGSRIMTADQQGEVVYIILSGTVKVHVEQADGTDVILTILGPGDILGEMSVLDKGARSASALTLEETTVLWMDGITFRESLRRVPELGSNLMRILTKRLRLANEQIQALAAMEVEGRVARQLLAFADRYGRPAPCGGILVPLRLTQSDIAALVGASAKRVNQVIVSYKERRYISIDQARNITILNRTALASRCASS
jgi:CRP/FNR family cyclic AMP-dependent transcriptional regulator